MQCGRSICVAAYLWSFFFFLDLIAWASLVPDVMWLFTYQSYTQDSLGDQASAGSMNQKLQVARAGRAARAGTRAARIVRIFKLLSFIKKRKELEKKALEAREAQSRAMLLAQTDKDIAAAGLSHADMELEEVNIKPPSRIGMRASAAGICARRTLTCSRCRKRNVATTSSRGPHLRLPGMTSPVTV